MGNPVTSVPIVPVLRGAALGAVRHRGSHLQIIASAGSGKTEVVSQRVADLLAEGLPPQAIVAFTFTERAATELKTRIADRVHALLGRDALDRMSGLFVGTIHAYCFRLLQQRVPRYETYDVLDDNQLTAFLSRESNRLQLRQLDPRNRQFASIEAFLKGVDVVENELLSADSVPDPFRSILVDYHDTLERYRLLTYGQQIVRAVRELESGGLAVQVHSELRHLIVDEYQDINPAQERLIELIAGPRVELCVVGDDDQAIYQWRGSDVRQIVRFTDRYPDVATFEISTNRRSRPQIIAEANLFALTIPERIDKTMGTYRQSADGPEPEIVAWTASDEAEEAGWIADYVLQLAGRGVAYRDIAVLVRTRASYDQIMQHFATFAIPVQAGGRFGLFDQPEAGVLARTYCWLADIDWRQGFGASTAITENDLVAEYRTTFQLPSETVRRLRRALREWKSAVSAASRPADLINELYTLLEILDVRAWGLTEPIAVNRLGTLARVSALLADYESVRRRARPDADAPGEQVGGQDRGIWYYRNLAIHIINHAQGAYERFDGEEDFNLDAVDLTTIHRAKGLEWPAVLVPSLTNNRFPPSRTGRPQQWLVPRDQFDADRYEGSDADERRLFYVAMTRARDWLSVSRHERVTRNAVQPSPYFKELSHVEVSPDRVLLPEVESLASSSDDALTVTYSELARFMDCGKAYRLRELIGFQPRLAPELGYGKAVHHIMRTVAEQTKATGQVPDETAIDSILDHDFFLPTANKAAHRQLRGAARRLVLRYTEQHEADLHRIWETERPFELHLDGVTVSGRADVILDQEDGVPTALAIVDYKTSTSNDLSGYALQLQVYADAGRREGLDVRGAYVHDLKRTSRDPIDVDPAAIQQAEATVTNAADRLRTRDYAPNPGIRCRGCEVRRVCSSAQR